MDFTFRAQGPFDLMFQNQFFNGWPVINKDTIVMAFPVEGWQEMAVVIISQLDDNSLQAKVYGAKKAEAALNQAKAALSLDEDGSKWADVGKRDKFIGELQQTYHFMRPSLFNSPYEAATAFIIGHRISITQARKLRHKLAEEHGEAIDVEGQTFHAFPSPQKLLKLEEYKGLNSTKIERLHAAAEAALSGTLDRAYLRSLSEEDAMESLQDLPGIGPFFAQGILYRGVGKTDGITHDDFTYHAVQQAYNLAKPVKKQEVLKVADKWRPYRMWATVLLHVWIRQTGNLPTKRTFSQKG